MAQPELIGYAAARTIPGLFRQRVARSPDRIAYQQFDISRKTWTDFSWRQMSVLVERWQTAFTREDLTAGDRVAVLLRNCVEWVCFDVAALSLGLVVTPLYTTDTARSHARLLADAGAKLLLLGDRGQWDALQTHLSSGTFLESVLCLQGAAGSVGGEGRFRYVADWLPAEPDRWIEHHEDPDDLATLVYTSGTTGQAKGVMLSHRNLLWGAEAALDRLPARREDVLLSILPMAHIFERVVGYYVPMMAGCRVAFARSVHTLPKDFQAIRPTALLSVPRLYERAYLTLRQQAGKSRSKLLLLKWTEALGERRFEAAQGRAVPPGLFARVGWWILEKVVVRRLLSRFGGRLRVAVSGGGRISERVARKLAALGVPIVEGYGLTEAGAVSANSLDDNEIGSVGKPLPGVEVAIDENGELLVRAPSVMRAYWNRPKETREVLDDNGWLRTGDLAAVRDGRVYVRGRLDEILVTSRGENVSAAELESMFVLDPLFDQVMVVGDGRPSLVAVMVLNSDVWRDLAGDLGLSPAKDASLSTPEVIDRILAKLARLLKDFPSYAQVRAVHLTLHPWTTDNDLLTNTMKLKRHRLAQHFSAEIDELYRRRLVSE